MNVRQLNPGKHMVRIDRCSLMDQNMARAERGERRLHQCCVCGQCGEWGPQWSWYGSVMDEDAGTVAKFCSPECRKKESGEHARRRIRNAV